MRVLSEAVIDRCSDLSSERLPAVGREPGPSSPQSGKPNQETKEKWIMVGGHPPAAADHEKLPKRVDYSGR